MECQLKVKLNDIWRSVLEHPKTTAAGVAALLALAGVAPEGHEEKIAIVIMAAGVLFSADAKRNTGAGGTDK